MPYRVCSRVLMDTPQELHNQVKGMYSWHNVAARTETVYYNIMAHPKPRLIER